MKSVTVWRTVLAALLAAALGAGCGTAAENGPAGAPPASPEISVTVYFADRQSGALVGVPRRVPVALPVGGIVQALLDGPLPGEDVLPTLPAGTQLLGARVHDGVATVNFSSHLKTRFGGGSAAETMLVYSVVNSLTALPAVRAVQFEVEGAPLYTLGHLDLSGPVYPQELDGGG